MKKQIHAGSSEGDEASTQRRQRRRVTTHHAVRTLGVQTQAGHVRTIVATDTPNESLTDILARIEARYMTPACPPSALRQTDRSLPYAHQAAPSSATLTIAPWSVETMAIPAEVFLETLTFFTPSSKRIHWSDSLQCWIFVYNVRRSVPPDVGQLLVSKQKTYSQLEIDHWSSDTLREKVRAMLLQQRAEILGAPNGYEHLCFSAHTTEAEIRQHLESGSFVLIQDILSPISLHAVSEALAPSAPC